MDGRDESSTPLGTFLSLSSFYSLPLSLPPSVCVYVCGSKQRNIHTQRTNTHNGKSMWATINRVRISPLFNNEKLVREPKSDGLYQSPTCSSASWRFLFLFLLLSSRHLIYYTLSLFNSTVPPLGKAKHYTRLHR